MGITQPLPQPCSSNDIHLSADTVQCSQQLVRLVQALPEVYLPCTVEQPENVISIVAVVQQRSTL